jgi:hypothetical protein
MSLRGSIKLTLFMVAFALTANAQIQLDKKFSKIPEESRERLIERLNLYFTSFQNKQYEKMYELIADRAYTGRVRPTKEAYIKQSQETDEQERRSIPVNFKVERIEKIHLPNNKQQVDYYYIVIKAKALYKGRVSDDTFYVTVFWEKDNWYFMVNQIEI